MTATDETPPQHSDPGEPCEHPFCVAKRADQDAMRGIVGLVPAKVGGVHPLANLHALHAQPDAAPAPDGNAGGADVYREAAKAMFELADGDNDDLFEWQNCPACPNGVRCACSGIPYPSVPVRAAIDAARAPLLAEVAAYELNIEELNAKVVRECKRIAAERDEAIRERDEARATLEAVREVEVRRLALKPGDVIVLATDRDLTDAEFDGMRGAVKDWFPGHDVKIVSGTSMTIVEPVTDDGGAG